jgi:hypothetical protein
LANVTIVSQKHSFSEAATFLEELMVSKHLPRYDKITYESLSFNHDFGVGLDWCGQIPLNIPKLKARIYRYIMLRSMLPHLLHKAITASEIEQKEEQQTNDDEVEVEKFRTFCEEVTEEGESTDVRVENLSWSLCHRLFKASCILKKKMSGEAGSTEKSDEVVDLLQQASALLVDIHAMIKISPHVQVGAAPLSRTWLSGCSAFIAIALPVLSLVLQQMTTIVTPVPKKKKNNNKKKKNQASSAAEGCAMPQVEAVVLDLKQATVDVGTELKSVLESLDTTPTSYAASNTTSAFPIIFTPSNNEDKDAKFKACRDAVFSAMASSQKLSVARAVPIVTAKIDALLPPSIAS